MGKAVKASARRDLILRFLAGGADFAFDDRLGRTGAPLGRLELR